MHEGKSKHEIAPVLTLRLMTLRVALLPGWLGAEPLVLGLEWSLLVLLMEVTRVF